MSRNLGWCTKSTTRLATFLFALGATCPQESLAQGNGSGRLASAATDAKSPTGGDTQAERARGALDDAINSLNAFFEGERILVGGDSLPLREASAALFTRYRAFAAALQPLARSQGVPAVAMRNQFRGVPPPAYTGPVPAGMLPAENLPSTGDGAHEGLSSPPPEEPAEPTNPPPPYEFLYSPSVGGIGAVASRHNRDHEIDTATRIDLTNLLEEGIALVASQDRLAESMTELLNQLSRVITLASFLDQPALRSLLFAPGDTAQQASRLDAVVHFAYLAEGDPPMRDLLGTIMQLRESSGLMGLQPARSDMPEYRGAASRSRILQNLDQHPTSARWQLVLVARNYLLLPDTYNRSAQRRVAWSPGSAAQRSINPLGIAWQARLYLDEGIRQLLVTLGSRGIRLRAAGEVSTTASASTPDSAGPGVASGERAGNASAPAPALESQVPAPPPHHVGAYADTAQAPAPDRTTVSAAAATRIPGVLTPGELLMKLQGMGRVFRDFGNQIHGGSGFLQVPAEQAESFSETELALTTIDRRLRGEVQSTTAAYPDQRPVLREALAAAREELARLKYLQAAEDFHHKILSSLDTLHRLHDEI